MSYITPIHPGVVLADELEELGVSQTKLAHAVGVLPKSINEIVHGRRGISSAMAFKLSKALGASPQFWMNLQSNWELSQVGEEEYAKVETVAA